MMREKKVGRPSIVLLIVTALSAVSVIFMAESTVKRKVEIQSPSADVIPTANIDNDFLENEANAKEVRENYNDLPIFYGDIRERKLNQTEDGSTIEAIIAETVFNITFWHYDEFEEDGFTITKEPDIQNEDTQNLSAVKDGVTINFNAEKINDELVKVKIDLSK